MGQNPLQHRSMRPTPGQRCAGKASVHLTWCGGGTFPVGRAWASETKALTMLDSLYGIAGSGTASQDLQSHPADELASSSNYSASRNRANFARAEHCRAHRLKAAHPSVLTAWACTFIKYIQLLIASY